MISGEFNFTLKQNEKKNANNRKYLWFFSLSSSFIHFNCIYCQTELEEVFVSNHIREPYYQVVTNSIFVGAVAALVHLIFMQHNREEAIHDSWHVLFLFSSLALTVCSIFFFCWSNKKKLNISFSLFRFFFCSSVPVSFSLVVVGKY